MPAPEPPTLNPADLIRRLSGQSVAAAAQALSAAVGAAPAERLDALMASPLRLPILEAIFWAMPRQLDARRARDVQAGARWRVTSRQGTQVDTYDLLVAGGRARVRRGDGGDPPGLSITIEGAELLRIVSGRSDPVRAYMARRLAVSGDIMVAARLVSLFRIPGSRSPRWTA